jgi:hypothetical protein
MRLRGAKGEERTVHREKKCRGCYELIAHLTSGLFMSRLGQARKSVTSLFYNVKRA